MCADRDSTPGLRALLGRFLHGLHPARLLQLAVAAWGHLLRLGDLGPSLSFLLHGWVGHRGVGAGELPEEVLEALRELELGGPLKECLGELGPWEKLGGLEGCLEELDPWTELVTPSKEPGLWRPGLEKWGNWKECVPPNEGQGLWKPGMEEAHGSWKFSMSPAFSARDPHPDVDSGSQKMPRVEKGSQIHFQSLSVASCILGPGSDRVFTWVTPEQVKDTSGAVSPQRESSEEIQYIRNKRLRFLQSNRAQEVLSLDPQQNHTLEDLSPDPQQNHTLEDLSPDQELLVNDQKQEEVQEFPDSNQAAPIPGQHQNQCPVLSIPDWHQSQLLLGLGWYQNNVLDLPSPDQEPNWEPQLSIPEHNLGVPGSTQNKDLSNPDQDLAYYSLEDWQFPTISCSIDHNFQEEGQILTSIAPTTFIAAEQSDLSPVPTEQRSPSKFGTEVSPLIDQVIGGSDPGILVEDMLFSVRPVCSNKYISYILGTPDSDEDLTSGSENEDWDDEDDDGFDSEGSMSDTDDETGDSKVVELWNLFSLPDPYNPQNFTATIHTGARAEEALHPEQAVDEETPSDEEDSWCDSAPESLSEGEDSADEEENLKLWNAFTKLEDPYNPLFFRAPVHTAEKRQSKDAPKKQTGLGRGSPQYCKLMSPPRHVEESHLPRTQDALALITKASSIRLACRKVTFHDHVTEYHVSNEDRKGPWEQYARDRDRFQRRIQEMEVVIGYCFTPDHRQKIWDSMRERWCS
ncbi:protein phosphatase 1 regulatory subunit 15B [Ascaphus truei]|uniref:protein phosphatase 1 regulatory subunit 15B n=1 Tax=Ascaphus truei TaxID=8439 RepID=UPI003F5AC057